MKLPRNPILLELLLTFLAVFGVYFLVFFLQRPNKIRQSAEDILLLATATADHGCLIPDWAYVSEKSRQRYNLLAEMPQTQVDEHLRKVNSDLPFDVLWAAGYRDYKNFHQYYVLNMNHWHALYGHYSGKRYLLYELKIRKHLSEPEIRELIADKKLPWIDAEEQTYQKYVHIPEDPFALPGTDRLYRYGLSPGKIGRLLDNLLFKSAGFVIAGNGPDGRADFDVTRFDAEISTATGKFDPFLGMGRNPIDLVYDPTNGAHSSGDIILIHGFSGFDGYKNGLPPGYEQLCDIDVFKKRYGLK